jgi:uncharacterized protein YgiM (DUF1202 family)
MPKLESSIAACLTLMVLASLAFALSFREGAAAPATDQWPTPPAIVATSTTIPSPTATAVVDVAPSAAPSELSPAIPTATALAPSPTAVPVASPSPEPSPQPSPVVMPEATPSPAATQSPAPPTAVVAVEWLNLREEPGTEYPVVTALGQGDVLVLTGEQRLVGTNRWVEVIAADGKRGWVIGGAIEMP